MVKCERNKEGQAEDNGNTKEGDWHERPCRECRLKQGVCDAGKGGDEYDITKHLQTEAGVGAVETERDQGTSEENKADGDTGCSEDVVWDFVVRPKAVAHVEDYARREKDEDDDGQPVGERKEVASASYDKTVKVWDAMRGLEVLSFKGRAPVWSVAFSADGQRLMSASADETVKVWVARPRPEASTPGAKAR